MGYILTMVLSSFVLLLSINNDSLADVESVDSPFYGEVLFAFYQKNYLRSITSLESAKTQNRLRGDAGQSELLRGGLYLSYGLSRAAEGIFKEVFDSGRDDKSRAQAMLNLAKLQYQRGYFDKAKSNLVTIENKLEAEFEDDRLTLLALIEIQENNYLEAIRILSSGLSEGNVNYTNYNLAVSLMEQGHEEQALSLLNSMSDSPMMTAEVAALIDKANLALAYYYLEREKFEIANNYFNKIRVQGPFSNQALLGKGWASLGQKQYAEAISVWNELVRRDVSDPSVLEGFLAIPYAHYKQGANKQALNDYKRAIDLFMQESSKITAGINAISFSELIDLNQMDRDSAWIGNGWQSEVKPGPLLNRYMPMLLASHEFQEGLKNYRDLIYIENTLNQWLEKLPVFSEMLEVRRLYYQTLVPKVKSKLSQLEKSKTSETIFKQRQNIYDIESSNHVMALESAHESETLILLDSVEKKLKTISHHQDVSQQSQRLHMLRGLMIWNIDASFKQRLWELKKKHNQLEREYEISLEKRESLRQTVSSMAMDFDSYNKVIAQKQTRITGLKENVSGLIAHQEKYLHSLLKKEFEKVVKRIELYRSQAMLSVAHILDVDVSRQEVVR